MYTMQRMKSHSWRKYHIMNQALRINSSIIYLLIIVMGLGLFVPFNGVTHLFDWDEINFAESSREMIETSDYLTVQIDYQPFWEKPPLFLWVQVASMKLFGVNEFAARFPNAVCGVLTLLLLFNLGKRIKSERFALLWVMAYAGSVLPFFYFKSGIIDPWFNFFIFLGVYFLARYTDVSDKYNKTLVAIFSGISIGLAVLTKGPVGLLIPGIAGFVFLVSRKFRVKVKIIDLLLFLISFIFVGGFWFLLQIVNGNFDVIIDFFVYQVRLFQTEDAGHGGFLLYHFVVLFIGVFPASVFVIPAFKKNFSDGSKLLHYKQWMNYLFWTVLILFTIVNTKIVHYSSMCYFPMAFLAAYYIDHVIDSKPKFNKFVTITLGMLTGVFSVLIIAASFIDVYKTSLISADLIGDKFAVGNLDANGNWMYMEWLTGVILMVGFILFLRNNKLGKTFKAALILFGAAVFFTFFTMVLIVPRVERYSQLAAIEFYEDLQGKDVYVNTLGFKSYAHLFYFEKPNQGSFSSDKEYLLRGTLDKDAYFVLKNIHKDRFLKEYTDLEIVYEKNGFVFTVRKK